MYIVAVVTRVSDDHAERYGPFEEFADARDWCDQAAVHAPDWVKFQVLSVRHVPDPKVRGYYGARPYASYTVQGEMHESVL